MYPIIDCMRTGKRIREYMTMRNITAKDIQNALGLTCVQAVYHWLNGRSLPSLENLYALSDLFQVPMDMLVVGNRQSRLIEIRDLRCGRLYAYCRMINEMIA